MIENWKNGSDVVLTQRTWKISITKNFKSFFYKILIFSSNNNEKIYSDSARLVDKKIIIELKKWGKNKVFKRFGSYIGYNQSIIKFDRPFRKK